MNINFPPELEQLIQGQVAAGRFQSPSEVVVEALRLLEDKEQGRADRIKQLRDRIDKGLSEADRGDTPDGEEFMQGLIDELDANEVKRKVG